MMGRSAQVKRPLSELSASGILWLINRVVFHPRGFALTLHVDGGNVTGWSLQGDGSEPWFFDKAEEDSLYIAAEKTLEESRLAALPIIEAAP